MPRPKLPRSTPVTFEPFTIDTPGNWLVLSDLHLPYHDESALSLAIATGRRSKVVGVLLNGDTLDSHEISRFDHDPSAPRYREEIECGKKFLACLRYMFPAARIVWKDGNHDERLQTYIMRHAPALFGFPEIQLSALLHCDEYGVEHVGGKRVIRLGKLNVVHGHEYPGGVFSPVNPARGLFLKARSVALCGHSHQTSEHHEPDITGAGMAAWSTGCLCQLHPPYAPLSKWNHGFAVVRVEQDGTFSVRNLRVWNGSVV